MMRLSRPRQPTVLLDRDADFLAVASFEEAPGVFSLIDSLVATDVMSRDGLRSNCFTSASSAAIRARQRTRHSIFSGSGKASGCYGVALTPQNTAVKDLRFRVAFNLAYAGAPLAEVGFTDTRGEPAAFCVIANGERTSPLRTLARDGVSYATWSKDGKGYILIGRMSEAQVAELARPLEARF
jgi:hypothetical protein